MNYLKAFSAGLVVPSIVLPILLFAARESGKTQILNILFLHFIPLIWGIWNVFYVEFLKNIIPGNRNVRIFLTGAILGLLVVAAGVYWLNIPVILDLPQYLHYVPLIVGPILYGILWLLAVKPLNDLLGVQE